MFTLQRAADGVDGRVAAWSPADRVPHLPVGLHHVPALGAAGDVLQDGRRVHGEYRNQSGSSLKHNNEDRARNEPSRSLKFHNHKEGT